MTADHWLLIAVLCASTIGLRAVGYIAGAAMMERPLFRRILQVFPGCLVTALVASALANGTPAAYAAALASLATAIVTRNIVATMAAGMAIFVAASSFL
ncbi:MAG: AzlD domain-containing protein [Pseudomonadota bacterium]